MSKHQGIMPITYSVNHRNVRILAAWESAVTADDLAVYVAQRVRDGIDDYAQIINLKASHFEIAPHELFDGLKQARARLQRQVIPRTAFVAAPGTATDSVARQLASLFESEGATVQVFESVDEADRWLDSTSTVRE